MAIEIARKKLSNLVDKYNSELSAGLISQYNEEATKTSFILPFLKEVLGWDVNNFSEVHPEWKVSRDKVDYGLKIEGRIKLFVEAKDVRKDLKDENIEQAIGYGYSSKDVPFVLLTNFKELKLFDVTIEPDPRNPAKGLKIDLSYDKYLECFEEIYLLSREAVESGDLDRLLLAKVKDRISVDKSILDKLKKWRESLAGSIFRNNEDLFHSGDLEKDADYLNEVTQKILDRIIFIRSCEDRGLMTGRFLKEVFEDKVETLSESMTMLILNQEFKRYNDIFNSDLFSHRDWEDHLAVEFKVIKKIVLDSYHPYQFDRIPLDVLGNIYEQYLGYTIRVTDHRVKFKLKPELENRKAMGIYYTPEYIVDYIVMNSIGKLLEELPWKRIKEVKIVDPACGSGSFLIKAYGVMLEYYRNHKRRALGARGSGSPMELQKLEQGLTIGEKSDILRRHIYGVDIDQQAVGLTKLSLMLKMLEGESGTIPGRAVLPMLDKNVLCGNSLIGTDYFDLQGDLFGRRASHNINPLDWNTAFPEVFKGKNPGFEIVIGNPPYIFTRNQRLEQLEKSYYYSRYKYQSSQLNTFSVFVEKCHSLMPKNGILGFITPNNWLTIDSFSPLRKFILNNSEYIRIANILDRVFVSANVDTAIVICQKGKPAKKIITSEIKDQKEDLNRSFNISSIKPPSYIIQLSLFKDIQSRSVLNKIESFSRPLSELCAVSTGLKVYQTGKGKPPQGNMEKEKRIFHSNRKINKTYGCYLKGGDVCRYYLKWSGEYLSYGEWIAEPRKSVPFNGERLLVRQIPSKPPYLIHGVFTSDPFYNDINSMVIFLPSEGISIKYLLGIINSRLLSFWFLRTFDKLQRKIFPQFKVGELGTFPIRAINLANNKERNNHDNIVKMVDQMMELCNQLAVVKAEKERNAIRRRIKAVDDNIDNLVYKIYDLKPVEIAIVKKTL